MDRGRIGEVFDRLRSGGCKGCTIDADGRAFEGDRGFAVGFDRCSSLGEAAEKLEKMDTPGIYIGWWIDDQDGKEYFNLTAIFDKKETAFLFGYLRLQACVYDFERDETIDITHFYDTGPADGQH